MPNGKLYSNSFLVTHLESLKNTKTKTKIIVIRRDRGKKKSLDLVFRNFLVRSAVFLICRDSVMNGTVKKKLAALDRIM